MSARILVVDDVPANVKVLQAKLEAAHYTVDVAYDGPSALSCAAERAPDLILLDVMMPGMDGFEVCSRLKASPRTALIPVVMVTALNGAEDRVRALAAGADDFLTKPPHDVALWARVRSLVRVKLMIDELRIRDETARDAGVDEAAFADLTADLDGGSALVVEPEVEQAKALAIALSRRLRLDVVAVPDARAAFEQMARGAPDLILVSAIGREFDGLRLCSEARARRETKRSAIIAMVEEGDFDRAAQALDIGATDYLMRPIDGEELIARVRSQLRRKRFADRLRADVRSELRHALSDDLTSLYNRRYADRHIERLLQRGRSGGASLSVTLLDIDRFKAVNDIHGHAAGDKVLVEFARRIAEEVRGVDLVSRYGGEEFLIVTPDADAEDAGYIAERVRKAVAKRPFEIGSGAALDITVSAGVAEWAGGDETAETMLARADAALYASKEGGRNRVTLAPAPASPPPARVA